MWCDLGKSVGTRTCDIFSSLFHWSAQLEMYILLKPHLNWSSGSKVMSNWRVLRTIENNTNSFVFLVISHNQCCRLPTYPARSKPMCPPPYTCASLGPWNQTDYNYVLPLLLPPPLHTLVSVSVWTARVLCDLLLQTMEQVHWTWTSFLHVAGVNSTSNIMVSDNHLDQYFFSVSHNKLYNLTTQIIKYRFHCACLVLGRRVLLCSTGDFDCYSSYLFLKANSFTNIFGER